MWACGDSGTSSDELAGTEDPSEDDAPGTADEVGDSGSDVSDDADDGSDEANESSDGGSKFDTLVPIDGGCGGGPNDATLTGTVYAPNGTIPVAGALVYVSSSEPEGIPDQVYCAECVELGCGTEFTHTSADGSFSLSTSSGPGKHLVVQKGQFMRVSPIDVAAGPTALAESLTELPGEWNPDAGLYIPKIAVGDGTYERFEDALGKLGLGDTLINDFEKVEQLIPGTESFDLWDNGQDPADHGFVSQGTFAELVADPNQLARYHIIFAPCSANTYILALDSAQNRQNIRDWVAAGGRWYVADDANEWLAWVFPEYQTFYSDGQDYDISHYNSLGSVLDDGLLEWLAALPDPLKDITPLNNEQHPTLFDLPEVLTLSNWSGIKYPLPELWVDDGRGGQVNVGHRAWIEGPGGSPEIPFEDIHPLTITGQYGCGRIQFTSYHASEGGQHVGLSPQELVLLYTILEIGTCQTPLTPPS